MKRLFAATAFACLAAPALAQTPPAGASAAAPPRAAPAAPTAAGSSLQDLQAQQWAQMSMLDTDKDGRISRAEWDAMAAMAPGQLTPAIFQRLDANKDGAIDRSEANAIVAASFALMDTNHDNRVSPDELQAFQAEAMKRMQAAQSGAPAASPPPASAQPPK